MSIRRTTSEVLQLAAAHGHGGRWDLCAELCLAVLAAEPDRAEALHLAGVARQRLGDFRAAVEYLERAVAADPGRAQYHTNLGAVCEAVGQPSRAFACFRRALELDPHSATAHYNAGNILRREGRLDEAEAEYRRALAENPDFPPALLNLAALWSDRDRPAEALTLLERAVALQPDSFEALNNLGILYRDLGRAAEAEACYRKALRINPQFAEAYCNFAGLLKEHDQREEAERAYQQAVRLKPELLDAVQGLAALYKEQSRLTEAAECYRQALRRGPNPLAQIELATLLPAVYASAEEMAQTRRRLTSDLSQLVADGVQTDFCKSTPHTLFYLAYQGSNDRSIHELAARLIEPPGPDQFPVRRAPSPRLRVGFVCKVLRDHTVGYLWQNMVAELSRERFEVLVWSPQSNDAVTERIRARADHWTPLPPRPALTRRQVLDAELDVLVFPEVGMDAGVWALAGVRMAPVQCVGWGHPVTTGFPSMDYFLSSRLMETADADEHYRERLVRFDGFGLCIDRPRLPSPASRAEFGLPEDRRLYGCLQSLFKIHPDDDPLLAEILRRDPQGTLVMLEGSLPAWQETLLQRFERHLPDARSRVRFLSRQTPDDFLRLSSRMDVMLDPLHFSGGRTSYEALAMGVPVVTLPSQLLRGRITLGVYRAMGFDDCIADSKEQYVELALRLAGDRDYRQAVCDKIQAGCGRFFDDRSAIREFEQFLLRAAAKEV
jgi:predicted O-linked N-acetylglucosamine transferase (SPINDLY family)